MKFLNFLLKRRDYDFIETEGDLYETTQSKNQDNNLDYISIEEKHIVSKIKQSLLSIKPYSLNSFEDVNKIMTRIRDNQTICFIDISVLKNKNPEELKRAVHRLNTTAGALGGEVVGISQSIILAIPKNINVEKRDTK